VQLPDAGNLQTIAALKERSNAARDLRYGGFDSHTMHTFGMEMRYKYTVSLYTCFSAVRNSQDLAYQESVFTVTVSLNMRVWV
jgi:hypothetical protein